MHTHQLKSLFKKDRYKWLAAGIIAFWIVFSIFIFQVQNTVQRGVGAANEVDILDVISNGNAGLISINEQGSTARTIPFVSGMNTCSLFTQSVKDIHVSGGTATAPIFSGPNWQNENFCFNYGYTRAQTNSPIKISNIHLRPGTYTMALLARNKTVMDTGELRLQLVPKTGYTAPLKEVLVNVPYNIQSGLLYNPVGGQTLTIDVTENNVYDIQIVKDNYIDVDLGALYIQANFTPVGPGIDESKTLKTVNTSNLLWSSSTNQLSYNIHLEMDDMGYQQTTNVTVDDYFDTNFIQSISFTSPSCNSNTVSSPTCSQVPAGSGHLVCTINNLSSEDTCDIQITATLKDPCTYNSATCAYTVSNQAEFSANISGNSYSYIPSPVSSYVFSGSSALSATQDLYHVNNNCTGLSTQITNSSAIPYSDINDCYLSQNDPNVTSIAVKVPVTWELLQQTGLTTVRDVSVMTSFDSNNTLELKRAILNGNVIGFTGTQSSGYTLTLGDMTVNPSQVTYNLWLFYAVPPISGSIAYDHHIDLEGYINGNSSTGDLIQPLVPNKAFNVVTSTSTGGYSLTVTHNRTVSPCYPDNGIMTCSYDDLEQNNMTDVRYTFHWTKSGNASNNFVISTTMPSDFLHTSYYTPSSVNRVWNGQGFDYTFSTTASSGDLVVEMDIPYTTNDFITDALGNIVVGGISVVSDNEKLNILGNKLVVQKTAPNTVTYNNGQQDIDYTVSMFNASNSTISSILLKDTITTTGNGVASIDPATVSLSGFCITANNNTVISCTGLSVAPGATLTLTYTVNISNPGGSTYFVNNGAIVKYASRTITKNTQTLVTNQPTANVTIQMVDISTNNPYYQIPGANPIVRDAANNGAPYSAWQIPNAVQTASLTPGTYNFSLSSNDFFDSTHVIVDGNPKVVTVNSSGTASVSTITFTVQAISESQNYGDIEVEVKEMFNGVISPYSGNDTLSVQLDSSSQISLSPFNTYLNLFSGVSVGNHQLTLSGYNPAYSVVQGGVTRTVSVLPNDVIHVDYILQLNASKLTVRVFDVTSGAYVPYTGTVDFMINNSQPVDNVVGTQDVFVSPGANQVITLTNIDNTAYEVAGYTTKLLPNLQTGITYTVDFTVRQKLAAPANLIINVYSCSTGDLYHDPGVFFDLQDTTPGGTGAYIAQNSTFGVVASKTYTNLTIGNTYKATVYAVPANNFTLTPSVQSATLTAGVNSNLNFTICPAGVSYPTLTLDKKLNLPSGATLPLDIGSFDEVTYEIDWALSSTPATSIPNLIIEDILPDLVDSDTLFVSNIECLTFNPCTKTVNKTTRTARVTYMNVPASSSGKILITVKLNNPLPAYNVLNPLYMVNTATGIGGMNVVSDEEVTPVYLNTISGQYGLALNFTVNPLTDIVQVGTVGYSLDYTLNVTNTSNDLLTGVTLYQSLPSYVNTPLFYTISNGQIVFNIGNMNPGQTVTKNVTLFVNNTNFDQPGILSLFSQAQANGFGNGVQVFSPIRQVNSVLTVVDTAGPDIALRLGTTTTGIGGTVIMNNGTYSGPTVLVNTPTSLKFVIDNVGTSNLILDLTTPLSLTSGSSYSFSTTNPMMNGSSIIAGGSSSVLVVNVDTTTLGSKLADLTVRSNDPDENPYVVHLNMNVVSSNDPEINVKVENVSYADGSTYDFGTVDKNDSTMADITIENLGLANLVLGSANAVSISGAKYSLSGSIPANSTSITPGNTSSTFNVNVNTSTTGTHTGKLTILSNDADEGIYTIDFTVKITEGGDEDFTVEKKSSRSHVQDGEEFEYTIRVENRGNTTQDVEVVDTISDGRGTIDGSNGAKIEYVGRLRVRGSDYSGDIDRKSGITLEDIEPGDTVKITYTVKAINPSDTAVQIRNEVELDTGDDDRNTVIILPKQTVTPPAVLSPNIQITKTASKDIVYPGDDIVYTITARNIGNASAYDVVISDVLPEGTKYIGGDRLVNQSGNNIGFNVGTIAVGQSSSVKYVVRVNSDVKPFTSLVNAAQVHYQDSAGKSSSTNVARTLVKTGGLTLLIAVVVMLATFFVRYYVRRIRHRRR